ncbi:unnamed protein product [Aphanomyces euteiches]
MNSNPSGVGGVGTPDPSNASRNGQYDYLLQQIVQLNTDLHKTVAMSQSLKAERDSLHELTERLKQDVIRSEEKCDKMQEVLMTETEFKVQSDRKHEQLVHKWKQQLEAKAKEFELLQRNLAPPKDLDQLRLAIQDEVEMPHRQRVQSLQLEIDKYREMFYNVRREYEILKTEHEQTIVNHGNELESTMATHEILINDLKRRVDAAEERAEATHMVEKVRRLEQDKDNFLLENHKLRHELEQVRQAKLDQFQRHEAEMTKNATQLAEMLAMKTNVDLELKAAQRQMQRTKEDNERLLGTIDDKEKKLREALDETMRLREQVKQKDLLLVDNHAVHTAKLRDLRAELDNDKMHFKEKQLEWMDQVATLQASMQQMEASFQKREKEWQMDQARFQSLQAQDAMHAKETIGALETKLAEKIAELSAAQEALDDHTQRTTQALEQEQLKVHRLQGEKESLTAKLATMQELVTKLKAENMTWRNQHKEMEQEYRVLQAKHRDAMQAQQESQSVVDQYKAKMQYLEDDLTKLTDVRTSEKEEFDRATTLLRRQMDEMTAAAQSTQQALKDELKQSVDKLSKALAKAERKRDAYKEKCFQVHARFKAALQAKEAVESQLNQVKEQHHVEVQHLLTQWSHLEEAKTTAMVGKALDPELNSFLAEVDHPDKVHFETVTGESKRRGSYNFHGTSSTWAAIEDVDATRCTSCWQLSNCKALNGLSLPDPIVGYTRNATTQLAKQGVCEDIDRAVTLLTIFGGQYQYKDTPACRALVYKLNCLTWASTKNSCPNAPLPPCRSMCVQVADSCVFMDSYQLFLSQVCATIPCTEKPTGNCVPGDNEASASFNRCTLHQDYLTLPLSYSWRPSLSTLVFIALLFICAAVWI